MALSGSCALLGRHGFHRGAIKNVYNLCNSSLLPKPPMGIIARCITQADMDHIMGEGEEQPRQKKISKAMKAYLERAREHDEFMKKETKEYEIGKRHLANMMGQPAETFTQEDVNAAIKYLFPSGLFEPKARPIMEDPKKIFPAKKAAEFDETGRPFHSLFYTTKPNYYQALYDMVEEMEKLNKLEDEEIRKGLLPNKENKADLVRSNWLNQEGLEKLFLEPLTEKQYDYFLTSIERLVSHPYSASSLDFIKKFRKEQTGGVAGLIIPPLEYNEQGRPYIVVSPCRAQSATVHVKIWGNGTGQIKINGEDITYFKRRQHREQVSSLGT